MHEAVPCSSTHRSTRCRSTCDLRMRTKVSQYLRSAHANRHAEARVSRCMNTRHAEGQVDVEVSSGSARRHATGHVDAHVSPRMRPEACETTHMRSGGISEEVFFRVLISPDQSTQDIDVGFWDLTSRVYLMLVLLCENLVVVLVVVCRSLLPQMPPASPIEDRGTAIPIEDRDRAIPERIRLCGVIVKGWPVSFMGGRMILLGPRTLNMVVELLVLLVVGVTSRKDHSPRGTVGAGVDWTSFAKDSFSRYMNVCFTYDCVHGPYV
ncbi:hypothetical protein F2Q70_00001149 [Brassica cretica]|uniref:Uncharacterized protein n=1 Tax=Brassica cretica TaxID=69181 RepID=A0A8S9J1R5_BRACR|nr:hypothetical protein F2Q70_00001149 [Brassica cretica]